MFKIDSIRDFSHCISGRLFVDRFLRFNLNQFKRSIRFRKSPINSSGDNNSGGNTTSLRVYNICVDGDSTRGEKRQKGKHVRKKKKYI